MIDLTQLLILLVILVATFMLTLVGVQVFFILKEFRATIQKANKILDNAGSTPRAKNLALKAKHLFKGIKRI